MDSASDSIVIALIVGSLFFVSMKVLEYFIIHRPEKGEP